VGGTEPNRNVRDFGWEIAHTAVSPRPPISLDMIVARTEGYTYDAKKVWGFSIVQGPFSVPRAKPQRTIRNCFTALFDCKL
jgi:hypothetical protein